MEVRRPDGLLTFVAGFVAIAVLLFVDVALSSGGGTTGGGVGSSVGNELLYAIGWIFYNAYFVDVVAGGQSVNLLGTIGGFTTVPTVVYYVVPALLLVASGRSVARKVGPGVPDGQQAAAGATLLAGYLPLVAAGSVLLTFEVGVLGTTVSVGPAPRPPS